MKNQLHILIIEDSVIFAEGLELLLLQNPSVGKVYWVNTFKKALDYIKETSLELVILDLNFEIDAYDGFIIAKKLKQQYPEVKIIILSQHTRINLYHRLFEECKVDAYVDKQSDIEEIDRAIEQVMRGKNYVDRAIEEMLEIGGWMRITPQEQNIIKLLCQGIVQKQIADDLNISHRTVESHLQNLFKKFKVKNSVALTAKYLQYRNAHKENYNKSTPPFNRLDE